MNKTISKKILNCVFLGLVFTLISIPLLTAAWRYGSLHQHTGYSTQWGYNGIPQAGLGDDCLKESLSFLGYTVAELEEDARYINIDWLSFTDHSYCLSSSEFNTVKTDCQNAQSGIFTCLWGEELSVDDELNLEGGDGR